MLTDERSRQAVEVMERYADGEAVDRELRAARDSAAAVYGHREEGEPDYEASSLILNLTTGHVRTPADARDYARYAAGAAFAETGKRETFSEECLVQACLLRDLFGLLPFRAVPVEESWLRWNDACVVKIAQEIYDERDFGLMPILADALEDSGCDHEDILCHCRESGEHVRGCWVVDLLLGKE